MRWPGLTRLATVFEPRASLAGFCVGVLFLDTPFFLGLSALFLPSVPVWGPYSGMGARESTRPSLWGQVGALETWCPSSTPTMQAEVAVRTAPVQSILRRVLPWALERRPLEQPVPGPGAAWLSPSYPGSPLLALPSQDLQSLPGAYLPLSLQLLGVWTCWSQVMALCPPKPPPPSLCGSIPLQGNVVGLPPTLEGPPDLPCYPPDTCLLPAAPFSLPTWQLS